MQTVTLTRGNHYYGATNPKAGTRPVSFTVSDWIFLVSRINANAEKTDFPEFRKLMKELQ